MPVPMAAARIGTSLELLEERQGLGQLRRQIPPDLVDSGLGKHQGEEAEQVRPDSAVIAYKKSMVYGGASPGWSAA